MKTILTPVRREPVFDERRRGAAGEACIAPGTPGDWAHASSMRRSRRSLEVILEEIKSQGRAILESSEAIRETLNLRMDALEALIEKHRAEIRELVASAGADEASQS